MSDSTTAAPKSSGGRAPRRNHALRARMERHRALRSAWSVLAPSGLSSNTGEITEAGRALNEDLKKLALRDPLSKDGAALTKIDARIDTLESQMRAVAFEVSVSQIRSSVPDQLEHNRRGVLDLLDLLLGAEIDELDGTLQRIPAIDYLITLLCTTGADAESGAVADPVTLTPRLYGLCERSGIGYDPALAKIEAEFFESAGLSDQDARQEVARRTLRRRKAELGRSYFAPSVLRAIVTYNAALLQRIDEEIWDSQDWGSVGEARDESDPNRSVFEAPALPKLGEALRRRARGQAPEACAIDRVAWCLDLDYPDSSERAALLADSVGLASDPKGTTILVGLLCRSAVVLADELPAIGVSPKQLSGPWVKELDEAIKQEVNRRITGDEYKEACALSELKTKFLYTQMSEVYRQTRGTSAPRPAPVEKPKDVASEARELASRALDEGPARAQPRESSSSESAPPRFTAARVAALAGVAAAVALGIVAFTSGDLSRFSGSNLDAVSPYLSRGARSGEGTGSAFVGRLEDQWFALDAASQQRAAEELVEALRARGVREIMVYDDDRQLRIQALGQQSVRVLSTPSG